MAENFYTIVTKVGLAKIANAQLTADKLDLATIVVGDGNGAYYNPPSDAAALKKEVWRGAVGSISVDPDNPNWIVIETVIPATVGGFTVREIGLLDTAGDMIAIGKYPETYKPVLADGSSKDLYVRMIIEVANTSVVTLKVDPTIVIASRKYVDDKVKQASDSIKDGSLTLPSLSTTNKTVSGAINEVKDGLTSHVETAATTATAGHVKLSSAVTSSDETKAATPAAVKKVNDSLETLAGPANSKSVKQLDTELGEHKNKNASSAEAGHMTAADKKKLDGVEAGATNYKHPATHPATMITEDATHRFVTDAEKTNWNGKETPAGAQEKVNALAGPGNTKTVKQLDDALTTHSADSAAHGIGNKALLKTTDKSSIVAAVNEAFTSASNGKSAVSAAITGVDPEVVIPPEPTFTDLAGAIGRIKVGIEFFEMTAVTSGGTQSPVLGANGASANSFTYTINTKDIPFPPKLIIAVPKNTGAGNGSGIGVWSANNLFYVAPNNYANAMGLAHYRVPFVDGVMALPISSGYGTFEVRVLIYGEGV